MVKLNLDYLIRIRLRFVKFFLLLLMGVWLRRV